MLLDEFENISHRDDENIPRYSRFIRFRPLFLVAAADDDDGDDGAAAAAGRGSALREAVSSLSSPLSIPTGTDLSPS